MMRLPNSWQRPGQGNSQPAKNPIPRTDFGPAGKLKRTTALAVSSIETELWLCVVAER
jgi:hypothetical protein